MMKKIFSFLILLVFTPIVFCQDYQAQLNLVDKDGYNKILLTPEIRSLSDNNINHLRIYDANKTEIPFVLLKEKTIESSSEIFEIISKKTIPNVVTSLVFENKNKINIEALTLKIANTNVSKKYKISGSNNNKDWFGLIDNQTIDNLSNAESTIIEQTFYFPLNNYKYLKFDFIDKNSLPINILEARLENSFANNKSDLLELNNFTQTITANKKSKETRIEISFDKPQTIDEIRFDITGPNFYLRNAELLVPKTRIRKKTKENYEELISSFMLSSKSKNQFKTSNLFTRKLIIIIQNKDNPELDIKKVSLFQTAEYIIADLKKDVDYSLIINNRFNAPDYDLAQANINMSDNFPTVSINGLKEIEKIRKLETEKPFWQTSTFLWICIILASIILVYFSFSLIKDLNKNDKK